MKMNKTLFEQRICTILRPQYKFLIFLSLLILFLVLLSQSNRFLSEHAPVNTRVLVVEGWLPDYALEEAIAIYTKGGYTKIITTGGPLSTGSYLKEYKDYANLAKATLVAMGMQEELVIAVPAPDVKRERTYHSALALQAWMKQNRFESRSFNLASLGPHTKRSAILFNKAFSEHEIKIGPISIVPQEYEPKQWYLSSEGVRTTINELIAFMYVLLLK